LMDSAIVPGLRRSSQGHLTTRRFADFHLATGAVLVRRVVAPHGVCNDGHLVGHWQVTKLVNDNAPRHRWQARNGRSFETGNRVVRVGALLSLAGIQVPHHQDCVKRITDSGSHWRTPTGCCNAVGYYSTAL